MQSSGTFARLRKEESSPELPREGTQGSSALRHLPPKHNPWDEEELSGAGERAQLVKALLLKHESLSSVSRPHVKGLLLGMHSLP